MKYSIIILGFLFLASCSHENITEEVNENALSRYISENNQLTQANLIACAAGKPNGLDGTGNYPTSIFFYPEVGATDFRYFETNHISNPMDFDQYLPVELNDLPVFNGYLRKFEHPTFSGERMAIVTYKTNGKLHICDPIRLKTNVKPTEVNATLATITENGITPTINWTDGIIDENVIYFQVISDISGNFISGTYTYDKNFTFYDLSNVVLNVSPTSPTPSLLPNNTYKFTLMAVSEDNWVNLIAEKTFQTH